MLSSKRPGPGGIMSGCTSPLPGSRLACRWKSSGWNPYGEANAQHHLHSFHAQEFSGLPALQTSNVRHGSK